MIGYLFDTSSLSLLAPNRQLLDETSVQAIRRHSAAIFLPTIAITVIHAGIRKLHRKGAERRAKTLSTWLRRLCADFGDRILPFDLPAGERAGALADAASATGSIRDSSTSPLPPLPLREISSS